MTSAPLPPAPRRRGRPPKDQAHGPSQTRVALIQAGLAVFTEQGYSATGIDTVLRRVGVPKGSFYHYFASKDAFVQAVVAAYGDYFAAKLMRWLDVPGRPALLRLQDFAEDAQRGMQRHAFQRGCLVGNLSQEMTSLPPAFRAQLIAVFDDWQQRTARCLREAQADGSVPAAHDCDVLAADFWTGWEGAVLRARLEQSNQPLARYFEGFLQRVRQPPLPALTSLFPQCSSSP